jgi:hypothetical protein
LTVPLPGYILLLLLATGGLLLLGWTRAWRGHLAMAFFATLVPLWLTTSASVPVWDVLAPVMDKLQFPWRWQTILAVAVAALAATLLEAFYARFRFSHPALRLGLTALLSLYVIAYAMARLPHNPAPYHADGITPEQMWAFDAEQGQVGASWAGEFLPRWVTEQRWAIAREPTGKSANADGRFPETDFTATPISQGYLHESYEINARQPFTLTLRKFFYPAWRLILDGRDVQPYPATNLGLLAVDAPAGRHTLAVAWGPTAAVWAGRVVTACGWLCVLLLWLHSGYRHRLAGWLVIGAVGLLETSGLGARTIYPRPIDADLGAVRLTGVSIQAACAGDMARVRLYWSILSPDEPLIAFVHVIAGDGRVVAQHDGPLAGAYTPAARWLPGLVLSHEHPIALPADLPPGSYALKAGLYPPGQPAAPLLLSGSHDPHVDIGALEVCP